MSAGQGGESFPNSLLRPAPKQPAVLDRSHASRKEYVSVFILHNDTKPRAVAVERQLFSELPRFALINEPFARYGMENTVPTSHLN